LPKEKIQPTWIAGNSLTIPDLIHGKEFDFIFSCPPYYDLEVYSDSEEDLSNKGTYQDFIEDYRDIIQRSVDKLKDNRFACFVVGDVRDKKGFYYNFVADTIQAFRDAGMEYYNEAILINQVGSLAIRINKQFGRFRKLGKTHQNVLVFYKGDPKAIPEDIGEFHLDEDILQEFLADEEAIISEGEAEKKD
jgi:DNA modification methylase